LNAACQLTALEFVTGSKELVRSFGMHVVLVGDSVIDNKAYVAGGPDVTEQLRRFLPVEWKLTSLAQDGAVIHDVLAQIDRLPTSATHVVISAGGNDALQSSSVLTHRANSVAGALVLLEKERTEFRDKYGRLLDRSQRPGLSFCVCTIYEPRFPERDRRRVSATALTLLNDVITAEAFARGIALIDLRIIFSHDSDFANPIEPSERGGMKLAKAVHAFVERQAPRACVFV
jgi:hypothetical protein